ncbi:MAG: DUF2079 domain-containing protein, partial [Fimbriimonas ginsengisoli]|nr:DUF2079 domain-containing protein [Fimbriimonas ginsengisoli]
MNQSFWALTHGLDRITVRPFNHYAREGPEPWRSVHFAPLRLALLPIYAVWPRPETLLVGHSAIFWLSLFGVARLARGSQESGRGEALWPLVAAGLWAATPATFLMSINDCRPLQMGVPFLFWAIAGYTERRPKLFAAAALAALAARQEYGIAIATLALVPAGPSGQYRSTWSWPAAALTLGLGWFAGYFVYLDQMFGPQAVTRYFTVPSSFARHGWLDVLGGFVATAGSLAVLAGGWSLLAVREPRYLAASLPLVTMIVERNLTRLLPGDAEWHMVRYAAIPVAWWVAGGVLALRRVVARPTTSHAGRSRGLRLSAALGVVVGWIAPSVWVQMRLAAVPAVVVAEDVQPVRQWIARIPSDAAVWCDYPFAAKLSGRARLYSYRDPPVQDTASG